MKKSGIFIKVFTYTMVSAVLLVCATAALFSQQFMSLYRTMQARQIIASYEPLANRIKIAESQDITEIAQLFYENNQSFEYSVVDSGGNSIYATPNADTSNNFEGDFYYVVHKDTDFSIIAQNIVGLESLYLDLLFRGILMLVVMLALCLVSAYVFARQMTKPIKQLANDTSKMAKLKNVARGQERHDELGDLTRDVHAMYEKLKDTIARLESEILKVREMEETQRYFFSAASHELKTPIAATSILLEGMLANIGDYKDHPKYLCECINLVDTQSKIVAEILEIVSLIDGKLLPNMKPVKLYDAVLPITASIKTLADSALLQIDFEISENTVVLADKQMLNRVLSNVILNAVQNTPKDAAIRIWSEDTGNHVRVYVLNTKTYIDEEILPKLFDPFYRADKARSRKDKRSGLGLTIVQKTLKAMDLSFSLENTNKGVLFWIDLQRG